MFVTSVFENDNVPISFEIFPPKGNLTLEAAREIAQELVCDQPDFMSVTYSAGGSGNGQATGAIAGMLQREFQIPAIAHITCCGLTRALLDEKIAELKAHGIVNVLALRGDRAPDSADAPRDFRYASDLISELAHAGFCVGAACYPEGHIDCYTRRDNLKHLKEKQDAGASFFVTQLFFENELFYRFREAAVAEGITLPITCGIMPFLSKSQVSRMIFLCGASLPSPIIKLLSRYEDNPSDLRQAGIDYACAQLCDLVQHGVDGLHIYTMNQPDIAHAAVQAVGRRL